MTSSAFRLVPYSLHFHSATVNYSSRENESFFNKGLFVTVTKMNLHFFSLPSLVYGYIATFHRYP